MSDPVLQQTLAFFETRFGKPAQVTAFAPGRVEVLGNHTDYNEGYVLSAAINRGTYFAVGRRSDNTCVLADAIRPEMETRFSASETYPVPVAGGAWSNYVRGVWAKLGVAPARRTGYHGVIASTIPMGAGLSSSAALEISAGLALAELFRLSLSPLALAKIGQAAEHDFVGVKCGLLDQISSLFGKADCLVKTDFRTLAVETVPLSPDVCLLACNTHVKHSLVDSEYNERRASCEEAAAWFRERLPHPVSHLRDVSMAEWEQHAAAMPPVAAKRSAHVIGENERVLKGAAFLKEGRLDKFGKLLFESHISSRLNFQNSCRELDFIVEKAERTEGVLGARLSGGGFGGSAMILVNRTQAEAAGLALARSFEAEFNAPLDVIALQPSGGARIAAMPG
jgi:galactokinase